MKATTETVYRCDFCNRAMVSAGFMKWHEQLCKKNPNNMHMCFAYCQHLTKEEARGEDGEQTFRCALQPELALYSFKLERYKKTAARRATMTRMPLACDKYEVMPEHFDIWEGRVAPELSDASLTTPEL